MKYQDGRQWQRHRDGQLYSDKGVLDLLLRGKTREEICQELDMPMGTVNTCCTRIYRRESCKNLAELIIKHSSGKSTSGMMGNTADE